jgi:hypothetical protein
MHVENEMQMRKHAVLKPLPRKGFSHL